MQNDECGMTGKPGMSGEQAVPRSSFIIHRSPFIIAFVLGAVTVLGFAPFSFFPLPVLTLAILLRLWTHAATPRRAAVTGFAYGLGFFLCGVSWVYVSLHDFGAMPVPLAALATLLFCAFLALFPGLAAALVAASPVSTAPKLLLVGPAVWTLLEWLRGWIFTGFPWLALGYSQVPMSPLAGYAPVVGVYGVTLATVTSAGLMVVLWNRYNANAECGMRNADQGPRKARSARFIIHHSSFIIVIIWLGGWGLQHLQWTQPVGKPVTVSLIQGNVPQDLKWQPERARATLENYRRLTLSSPGELIVLPETALPLFLEHVPREYLEDLAAHARKNGGDILIGVPERLSGGRYYNSVMSIGRAETQFYRKSHLVPFGEFIPLRPLLGWIVSVLSIPMQDFSAGPLDARPLEVAGQRVAVNICYEDAFGEGIIRQLPHATLLANVSNVAWFGRSIAPRQHLQISQARALETGRYMLRATNTGVTAVVNPRGEIERQAPEFTRAIVTHPVQGFAGTTPYVRWGNYTVLALAAVMLIAAACRTRKSDRLTAKPPASFE
jgi:apolipoprotein N-acyltransferase